jgi:hypothetical protein
LPVSPSGHGPEARDTSALGHQPPVRNEASDEEGRTAATPTVGNEASREGPKARGDDDRGPATPTVRDEATAPRGTGLLPVDSITRAGSPCHEPDEATISALAQTPLQDEAGAPAGAQPSLENEARTPAVAHPSPQDEAIAPVGGAARPVPAVRVTALALLALLFSTGLAASFADVIGPDPSTQQRSGFTEPRPSWSGVSLRGPTDDSLALAARPGFGRRSRCVSAVRRSESFACLVSRRRDGDRRARWATSNP